MVSRYVLVLDAGTSGGRCLVFDGEGRITGLDTGEWTYLAEENVPSLARAFDPQGVWLTFCRLIANSLKSAGITTREVSAISVTSQRQAVVFLDEDGREVYAGPNTDLRAVFEGAAIDDQMRDRVYCATGHLPSFLFAPAKLRWFQHHRPESYNKIAAVLSLADWLVWRLTGNLAGETTLACEAGLVDINRREWCSELMSEMGLLNGALPLVNAGTMAGNVCGPAAQDSGLPRGTPVAVAGADTQCGLLGMGVTREPQTGIVAGWSTAVQMATSQPVLSPEGKTWAGCGLNPDGWVLESSPGDTGNSYRWLSEMFYKGYKDAFAEMDRLASSVPIGSEGTSAFLGPARMDISKLGMRMGGFYFPVPLTFSAPGPGHMARASLEAIAYAVKANLEQIEGLAGVAATDVTVGGGMTRSSTWTRILADVLDRELKVVASPQVSGMGAYLSACTALGEYGSLDEAAQEARTRLLSLEPDPLASAEYQDYYAGWLRMASDLQALEP